MKQKIVSRWDSSKVLFECEVPDDVPSGLAMRHALEKAVASGSNLRGSNLSGSDLSRSDLRDIKTDFFEVLLRASTEVAGLRVALVSGKVDGSTYEGECACLVGSIANVRQANYRDLPNELKPNAGRPAERWFLGIKKGDTPETNQISRITVEWLDYFVGLLNIVKAAS